MYNQVKKTHNNIFEKMPVTNFQHPHVIFLTFVTVLNILISERTP